MESESGNRSQGKVASLHLHPSEPGARMIAVDQIELVEAKGVLSDSRYFDRLSKTTGKPTRRQVSLIEREQIAEHARSLRLETIEPGLVRANIETINIELKNLPGAKLEVGNAVILVTVHRDPCLKMDAIAPGLRQMMDNCKQGVLAEVVRSGTVKIGDPVRILRN